LMAEWDLSEFLADLKNFNSKIKFLVGEMDKTVPISVSKKWSNEVPNGDYIEICGAGHLAQEEKPSDVSQSIKDQLSI